MNYQTERYLGFDVPILGSANGSTPKDSPRIPREMREKAREILNLTPTRERSLESLWHTRVPWERMGEKGVSTSLLRTISFFRDVETLVEPHYENHVLAGITNRPDLTVEDIKFINQTREWGHQEKGHGEFLSGFEREHARVFGEEIPPPHNQTIADLMNQRSFAKRHANLLLNPLAKMRPLDFRMMVSLTGTLTEFFTWIGYNAIREEADHPVLNFGMGHIMGEEKGHGEYYFGQAEKILSKNPRKRNFARWYIANLYKPVGTKELGTDGFDFAINRLLASKRGVKMLSDKDWVFSSLPGMEGLTPLTDAITKSQKRYNSR